VHRVLPDPQNDPTGGWWEHVDPDQVRSRISRTSSGDQAPTVGTRGAAILVLPNRGVPPR